MKKYNIPFSPPDISEEEISEVVDTLKSGWITTGPKTKTFEKEIANYCHTEYAVCLNSATAALEMALRILGVGPGDEVITTAYTYTASASVVCHVGAKLVLVDTAKDSYEMDYAQLENAITEKTKVIIPVDLAGIICDYRRIYTIVEKKKHLFHPENEIQKKYGRVIVCADGAHAFGAEKGKQKCGEIADFTSFSFHAVKNLTTAEGGALTWKKQEHVDGQKIYKKLMTDIMASIGLAQFRRYPSLLKRRREIIEFYNRHLDGLPIQVLPHYVADNKSSGHLYIIRINGKSREEMNEIIKKMAEQGVATNVHYKPLPCLSAYKNMGFDIKDYPNAAAMYENTMTLPLHTKLTDEDVAVVIDVFKECAGLS